MNRRSASVFSIGMIKRLYIQALVMVRPGTPAAGGTL